MGQVVVSPNGRCCGQAASGEFEWLPEQSRRFSKHTLGNASSFSSFSRRPVKFDVEDSPGEEALNLHRQDRAKSASDLDLISKSLQSSPLCEKLGKPEIKELIAFFNYYEFQTGDVLVKHGSTSSYFYIAHTQGLDVIVGGATVAKLEQGKAFGELAFLSQCPRNASVVATRPGTGVWAADAKVCRQALKAFAGQQVAERRKFLESFEIFKSLSVRQLDMLCDSAYFKVLMPGERPIQRGREISNLYFVRSGELQQFSSRDDMSPCMLRAGSCIGDHGLLYGEAATASVEVVRRCELLCLSVRYCRQVLGADLAQLQMNQRPASPRKTRVHNQLMAVLGTMQVMEYTAGAMIEALQFLIVADGSVQVGSGPDVQVLRRGHSYGSPEPQGTNRAQMQQPASSVAAALLTGPGVEDLAAGPTGCRLLALPNKNAQQEQADNQLVAPSAAKERMYQVMEKVCVFRHLPRSQILGLVNAATSRTYQQDETVVTQGEHSSHFFVVADGELRSMVDGHEVRRLMRCAYFGERALLFDEPRAATIQVVSPKAQILAVEKHAFMKVVRERTQTAEMLLYRVWLQDPGIQLGHLRRLGVLGRGTSGIVHLVQNQSSGFKYALKRVKKVNGEVPHEVQREIEVLQESDHPFIMHLVKTFQTAESVYLLTEHLAGGELHAAIRSIPTVLSRRQAMFYTGSLLLILECLHDRRIVYRDLKPENVMLDAQGYLKLIDFGSAKKLEVWLQGDTHNAEAKAEEAGPRTFTVVGTPHYTAPEVINGVGYGVEVDIWALGVILYELVCGCLPFGDNLEEVQDVCKAVIEGDLQYPQFLDDTTRECSSHVDDTTRELISALLNPDPTARRGCGQDNYSAIKDASFFGLDRGQGKTNDEFFERLIGRELQVPIAPSPPALAECSTAEDLCDSTPTGVLHMWRKSVTVDLQDAAVFMGIQTPRGQTDCPGREGSGAEAA